VDRTQFEALRDLPNKRIQQDIRFSRRQATAPAITADGIPIENSDGIDARLNITYNPEVGSKTFNVHVVGVGPICRVDVDGPAHRPAGRSHKHALRNERCPDRNLPDHVHDRPDLSGKNLLELFEIFCQMAHIEHVGTFEAPDQG
jgi:hypothetical protein